MFDPKDPRPKLLKQFQGLYVDPIDAARLAASHLFSEIWEELGVEIAWAIFARFRSPAPRQRQRSKNKDLLSELDQRGNLKALARDIAGKRHRNPTPQQIATVERHIQRINATRKKDVPEIPAALDGIRPLSYSKRRNLFRDNTTGKLYRPDGTEAKPKRPSRKTRG